jgi:hypothetical protein
LPLIVLAAAAMGAAIYAADALLPGANASQPLRFAILAFLVVLGLAVYLALLWLMGVLRLDTLRSVLAAGKPVGSD